jgi:hypothetical protein
MRENTTVATFANVRKRKSSAFVAVETLVHAENTPMPLITVGSLKSRGRRDLSLTGCDAMAFMLISSLLSRQSFPGFEAIKN